MPIRVLPPGIAALIAAGEVIERPASVIRELLDNAIDAGATSIEVIASGSGFHQISVSDNGPGMDPADLELCLDHHATSKLPGNQVRGISTLGFRGEALASIAAVSTVIVLSRPSSQDVAFSVTSKGGKRTERPRPSAGGHGTRVTVGELFFNHPARLKFLKSDQVEKARIVEAVQKAALAHPGIEFRMTIGRDRIHYMRAKDTSSRMRDVLAREMAADSVPVAHDDGGYGLEGLVSLPSALAASSSRQVFMVNGRAVTDRALSAVVASVYKSLTGARETVPVALHLRVPHDDVDVNVHPQKSEVRFLHPGKVAAFVREGISAALDAAGLRTPSAVFEMARRLSAPGPDAHLGDKRRLPLGRFMGQAGSMWIISETTDGIALVDQHAAHERIILERLKTAVSGGDADMVSVNPPVSRDLTVMQSASLSESLATLENLGFSVSLTHDTALLRGYPAVLEGCVPSQLFSMLIDICLREVPEGIIGEALWETLATAACKAAIKAGDELDPERADRLLREIERTPLAAQCNHGRPTMIFLKSADIAKLFGR